MRQGLFRPEKNILLPAMGSDGRVSRLEVKPSGYISLEEPGPDRAGWISLDQINFMPSDFNDLNDVGGAGKPVFKNGWTNDDPSYRSAGYGGDREFSCLKGSVKDGTNEMAAFMLPPSYRLKDSRGALFLTVTSAGIGQITVFNDGNVVPSAIAGDSISLENVRFNRTSCEWNLPEFLNGWDNYGDFWGPPAFYQDATGTIHLKGVITGGTLDPADGVIFVLPSGLRPSGRLILPVICSDSMGLIPGRVDITPDGEVIAVSGSSHLLSLWGVSFVPSGKRYFYLPDGHGLWINRGEPYTRLRYRKNERTLVEVRGVLKEGKNDSDCARLPEGAAYNQDDQEGLTGKIIRLPDFTETLNRGNALREDLGYNPVSWKESAPSIEEDIKRSHMDDLRRLSSCLTGYGGHGFTFSDSVKVEAAARGLNDPEGAAWIKLNGEIVIRGEHSWTLVLFDEDLSVTYSKSYDVYSSLDEAEALREFLEGLSVGTLAAFHTNGEPRNNVAGNTPLVTAIARFGTHLTADTLNSLEAGSSYVLLGRKEWHCYFESYRPPNNPAIHQSSFNFLLDDDGLSVRARHMEEVRQSLDDRDNNGRCMGGCHSHCGGSTCYGSCDAGCYESCYSSCSSGCLDGCRDDCYTGCSGSCFDSCSGECLSSCTSLCVSCTTTCSSVCTGYCSDSCIDRCISSCSGGTCGISCSNTCGGHCSDGCQSNCGRDCGQNCSGACRGQCEGFCTSGCGWFCMAPVCSGSNCSAVCSGSCKNYCYQGCHGGCSSSCSGTCQGGCGGATCANSCSGICANSCSALCDRGCAGSCISGCRTICSKDSCTGFCQNSCSSVCGDSCQSICVTTCSGHCDNSCGQTTCSWSCYGTCMEVCSFSCRGTCYDSCLSGCFGDCINTARYGADPGSYKEYLK